MKAEDVVVVSALRTAIGDYGGALKDIAPCELASHVLRSSLAHAEVDGVDVGHVVFGNVIHTEPRDMYLSRVAALEGGCSQETPAFNVNRLCGSGLQAIVSAAQCLMLGDAQIAVAGGAESMSRAAYIAPAARWGARMGDSGLVDMMNGALHDPFDRLHMGVTAENVAQRHGITRLQQDELAVLSHQRAARAIHEGRFREQIVPVALRARRQEVSFDTDEHVREDASVQALAKLRPVFAKEQGTVTAGNASGLNDAAAAVVLMQRRVARERGAQVLGGIVSYAHAGVDPRFMGMGPVPASRLALARAGLTLADMDVIELNEAFAAQACAVMRELELDAEKVNVNGSGISLGHPIGATGAILVVKALHELRRIGGRYALVTLCIGGGQGLALVLSNGRS
ncbi:acetyl-CoA C-acyltransferase family protein [Pusillimonas noertemannii]|uniref:acetyl-CoA C-acyltransferase family protein n=1 Tax=Pusillimonas noertemannii TaxID=305977 RepID=UPI003340FB65